MEVSHDKAPSRWLAPWHVAGPGTAWASVPSPLWLHHCGADVNGDDIVEAHCYFVDIGRIDREQIRSRINNNDCRTFRPRRPLSTAYRTVLYAVDKGLRGRNVLQSLLLILLRICSRSIRPVNGDLYLSLFQTCTNRVIGVLLLDEIH